MASSRFFLPMALVALVAGVSVSAMSEPSKDLEHVDFARTECPDLAGAYQRLARPNEKVIQILTFITRDADGTLSIAFSPLDPLIVDGRSRILEDGSKVMAYCHEGTVFARSVGGHGGMSQWEIHPSPIGFDLIRAKDKSEPEKIEYKRVPMP